MSNYRHRIRHHQSGLEIIDHICGAIFLTAIIAGMSSLVLYANHRDSKAMNQTISSFPSRPQDIDPDWNPDEQYQHEGC